MPKTKNIHYIHFDSIDSTNSWAKRNIEVLDTQQLSCITAQEQTAGRGRWNRKWFSPRGQNIYASLVLCIPHASDYLDNMGQVLALSCAQILQERGFFPQLKWPNDILLKQQKVAGILSETIPTRNLLGVILGIGMNVNMAQDLLDTIDQPATSLAQLSGHSWQVEQILDSLLQQFLTNFGWLQRKGFRVFQPVFEKLLAYKSKRVSHFDGYKTMKGVCVGIDEKGHLKLRTASQKILLLGHGEIVSESNYKCGN